MSVTEPRLVSVIIPAYNSGQWITDCVTSVLRQTYGKLQIIAVDDGSSDDTYALLKRSLPSGALLIRQANRGVAVARNVGLSRATGHFVAFLDHDDLWKDDKIQSQVDYMESRPDVAVVYTDAEEFTTMGRDYRSFTAMHPEIVNVEQLCEAIIRCQVPLLSTVMLRREYLVKHKITLDAEAAGVDDVGLFLELLGRNARFAYMDRSCIWRRMHPQNQSRDHLRRFEKRIVLYQHLLSRCSDMEATWTKCVRYGLSDAHFRVGEHYWGQDRRREARQHFQKALKAWKGNRKALLGLLYTYLPPPVARILRKAKHLWKIK